MTDYVLPPAPPATVAVAGRSARFPVRRIWCVGRNYAAHAREMGKDPDREPPFFFSKPADAVVDHGATLPFPPMTSNLHFEAEMVVALASGGRDIAETAALSHVWGYAVGNDLTRRDLQQEAKDMGRPWDLAKGFDASALCGPLHPTAEVGHPASGAIGLSVNGETRQSGDLAEMIWTTPEIIAFLSRYVELRAGDLIYTGTPAGVGALKPGDLCVAHVEGLGEASVRFEP